jgi:hypothetical protein
MLTFLKSNLYKGDLAILDGLEGKWVVVRNNILECAECNKRLFLHNIRYLAQTGSYGWIIMFDEMEKNVCIIYNLVDGKVLSTEISMEANLTTIQTSIVYK